MAGNSNWPTTELHPQFSSDGATATPWAQGRESLEKAQVFWLSTVRDGRPHVTPLLGVWLDGALYFCTGPSERKALNLSGNAHCAITTGCNVMEGLDLILEGDAAQVSDDITLQRLAGMYNSKYGWHYEVREGAFYGEGGKALVFRVAPATAFGFGRGETFSQTRWRFQLNGEASSYNSNIPGSVINSG